MSHNLLGPEPVLLPRELQAQIALHDGVDPAQIARVYPQFSAAWAALAESALADGEHLEAYAYARTGYHRGLDQLRQAGWKGHGPIPWAHQPNQGFLRSLAALVRAAEEIGEHHEAKRCRQFLIDCDPTALAATHLGNENTMQA